MTSVTQEMVLRFHQKLWPQGSRGPVAPNAGGLGSTPGRETRLRMVQLRRGAAR